MQILIMFIQLLIIFSGNGIILDILEDAYSVLSDQFSLSLFLVDTGRWVSMFFHLLYSIYGKTKLNYSYLSIGR